MSLWKLEIFGRSGTIDAWYAMDDVIEEKVESVDVTLAVHFFKKNKKQNHAMILHRIPLIYILSAPTFVKSFSPQFISRSTSAVLKPHQMSTLNDASSNVGLHK